MSESVINYFIKQKYLEQEYSEIYVYVMERKIALLSNMAIIITFAILFHQTLSVIIFVTFYSILRRGSGGIHANTNMRCLIAFLNILTIGIITADCLFTLDSYLLEQSLILIAFLIVYKYAPVGCKNRKLKKEEIIFLRKKSIKIILLQIFLIETIFIFFSDYRYIGIIAVNWIVLQSVTLIPLNKFIKKIQTNYKIYAGLKRRNNQ